MSKKDMVFVIGSALAKARAAHSLTQQQLSAAYEPFMVQHALGLPRARRSLHNAELSRIENSAPGQTVGPRNLVPSKQERQTAEALARLLDVPPAQIIQEIVLTPAVTSEKPATFVPTSSSPPVSTGAVLLGGYASQPAIELTFIPVAARALFVSLGGNLSLFPPTETRRVYLRGALPTMYTGRVVFEVDGDSMEPYINSGDEVIAMEVPQGQWEAAQNGIFVVCLGDRMTIKKIVANDLPTLGTLTLLPFRAELAPMVVGRAEIHAMFMVEEVRPRTFRALI